MNVKNNSHKNHHLAVFIYSITRIAEKVIESTIKVEYLDIAMSSSMTTSNEFLIRWLPYSAELITSDESSIRYMLDCHDAVCV